MYRNAYIIIDISEPFFIIIGECCLHRQVHVSVFLSMSDLEVVEQNNYLYFMSTAPPCYQINLKPR